MNGSGDHPLHTNERTELEFWYNDALGCLHVISYFLYDNNHAKNNLMYVTSCIRGLTVARFNIEQNDGNWYTPKCTNLHSETLKSK